MTRQEKKNDIKNKEARAMSPRVGTYTGIHTTHTRIRTHTNTTLRFPEKKKNERKVHASLSGRCRRLVASVVLLDAASFRLHARAHMHTHTRHHDAFTQSRQASRLLERLGRRHGGSKKDSARANRVNKQECRAPSVSQVSQCGVHGTAAFLEHCRKRVSGCGEGC